MDLITHDGKPRQAPHSDSCFQIRGPLNPKAKGDLISEITLFDALAKTEVQFGTFSGSPGAGAGAGVVVFDALCSTPRSRSSAAISCLSFFGSGGT